MNLLIESIDTMNQILNYVRPNATDSSKSAPAGTLVVWLRWGLNPGPVARKMLIFINKRWLLINCGNIIVYF